MNAHKYWSKNILNKLILRTIKNFLSIFITYLLLKVGAYLPLFFSTYLYSKQTQTGYTFAGSSLALVTVTLEFYNFKTGKNSALHTRFKVSISKVWLHTPLTKSLQSARLNYKSMNEKVSFFCGVLLSVV